MCSVDGSCTAIVFLIWELRSYLYEQSLIMSQTLVRPFFWKCWSLLGGSGLFQNESTIAIPSMTVYQVYRRLYCIYTYQFRIIHKRVGHVISRSSVYQILQQRGKKDNENNKIKRKKKSNRYRVIRLVAVSLLPVWSNAMQYLCGYWSATISVAFQCTQKSTWN